ncbi:MAG: CHAT domain-containing protein, partial [Deltaproteobacteria bacterium]|nr:CHAT domain-containing protein [Deltaproteobacteria bacterium]
SAQVFIVELQRIPDLLFLSGCETGRAAQKGAVPSLAEHLIAAGARAVLGWGRSVGDHPAQVAATTLYAKLACGFDLATALSQTYPAMMEEHARLVKDDPNTCKNEVPDWALLRLYLAGPMPEPLVTTL